MSFLSCTSESHSVIPHSLWPHGLYSPRNSLGQNTGVGSFSLLQGIFPTQGSNPGLPHCRWILYQLSQQASPRILEWVAYPFSRGSSRPRNQTGVSCIAGRFLTNWAIREAHMYQALCQLHRMHDFISTSLQPWVLRPSSSAVAEGPVWRPGPKGGNCSRDGLVPELSPALTHSSTLLWSGVWRPSAHSPGRVGERDLHTSEQWHRLRDGARWGKEGRSVQNNMSTSGHEGGSQNLWHNSYVPGFSWAWF